MGDAARKVWGFKGKQMMKSKRVLGAVDARPASGAGQRAYPAVFRDKASGQVLAAMSREQGRYGRPTRARLPIGRGWPRLGAALSSIWRWRGVLEGELAEACARLSST